MNYLLLKSRGLLESYARKSEFISYGDFCEALGMDLRNDLDKKIIEMLMCNLAKTDISLGRPPISALVIRKKSGKPTRALLGYLRRALQYDTDNIALSALEFWVEEVKKEEYQPF